MSDDIRTILVAIVKNNKITQSGMLQDIFPHASFPVNGPSLEFITEHSIKYINHWKPHSKLEKLVHINELYIENDEVYDVKVINKTEEDLAQELEIAASQVRAERTRLLMTTDWSQGKDIPDEISSKYTSYRQLLRDITLQSGFPHNVTYPSIDE